MGKFIPYSVLRRAHSVVQSEFSPGCDLVLLFQFPVSFPQDHPVVACLLPRLPVTHLQLHVNAGIMMVTALFRLRRSLMSTATCECWDYDGNSFI